MEKEWNGFKKRLAARLWHPLAPPSERMVLIRAKSSASILAFAFYICPILFCSALFLIGVAGLLNEISIIFSYWSDFDTWNAWLQGISQFWGQIFLSQRMSFTSHVGWWLIVLVFYLTLIALTHLTVRYLWRRLWGLFAYTRAKNPKAFAPHSDIIPVPEPWFSTKVLSEIKLDDASNLVEENPEIWEASVAAWRQKHPPEPIPLARIQIRLTQRCEIVLQPLYEWIAKADFAPLLYGADADNFNMDVHRLHEEINKKAQEHNLVLLDETRLGQTEERTIPIRLLDEPQMIHGRSCWRLKPGCVVEIMPPLQTLYEQARDAQGQQDAVDLAAREQAIMNLAQSYGVDTGLLGVYQTNGAWEWLKETYHHYRTMWLFLLADTAERELRRANEAPDATQATQPLMHSQETFSGSDK